MADPLSLLHACDAEQVKLMEEQVILVDYNDRPIGAGSKKDSALARCFCALKCVFDTQYHAFLQPT